MISIAIAFKTFLIIGWLIYLHTIVPWYMQILFIFFLILIPYTFINVNGSDPGFINVNHKVLF